MITCEYPPQIGGVSDYAFVMSKELARTGSMVHVWCGATSADCWPSPGVTVHRKLGRFSPLDLYRAGKLLDQFAEPRELFVQWVPHGYGYRSVNVFFCLWLWMRAKVKRDHVQIMFHEVWLSFGGTWKANMAAAAHRVMVMLLKQAASKIWIAGESWKKYLRGTRAPIGWLPVPSNVDHDPSSEQVAAVRKQYSAADQLVGHFGIGDASVEKLLRSFIPSLLHERPAVSFLLIGKSSERFAHEMKTAHPDLSGRIFSSGVLLSHEISAYISACDLIFQPYIDGISTRRTAAMAALANGRPLLTTSGHSTEPFWLHCDQLAIIPAKEPNALVSRASQLLEDDGERVRMAMAGRKLYEALFDVSISVQVLRGQTPPLQQESIERAVLGLKS